MAECSHDCANCSSKCSEGIPKEQLNPLSSVKHVIGVVSGKGGVGKSIVTSMLAVLMQRKGYKTAILDADITGPSIPRNFGIKERAMSNGEYLLPVPSKTGIDIMSVNLLLEDETRPVVWRGPVIAGTVKQFWTDCVWNDVDYMFVDMPPGTGDVPLTVFQSLPIDGIVVVTTPQDLVSMIVEKATKMAQMMNIPIIGIVENMSYIICPDCGKKIHIFGEEKINKVASKYGYELLGNLPMDGKLASLCDKGIIELMENDFLDKAVETIENKFDKK
ncbi:MAG: Mrp/NBP35 family ATP-binding protein [Ruminococcaceae bacterium]|nr:Mrp/NBP35 family ATP-binding protein [Oscillospiraceae bacterium]